MARNRWVFIVATFVFLGLAYYSAFRNRKKNGPWGFRILSATTLLSVGMVIYSAFFE